MAKRLPFRDNSPQVKDAIDQIQRGDFTGQNLDVLGITASVGIHIQDRGIFQNGITHGTNTTGIKFEVTSSIVGAESKKMMTTIRDTEYMRFENDYDSLATNQHQIIFNDGAADIDFIVKGDGDANLITTRASTDKVGIGVAVPRAKLEVHMDNSSTWSNTRTYSNYQLLLKNNNDTVDAFAGIAFDVSSETDLDAIGAAIVAINRDSTAADHHTDLVFATNPDSDDDLTERMRITEIGHVSIGASGPNMGTTADAALHIDATEGDGFGNLKVQCSEATIDANQSLVALLWTGDSAISSNNYWIKFVKSNGSGGTSQVGSINGEVNYTPFTGQHNTLVPSGSIRPGMILKSTGNVFYRENVSNAWVVTKTTTTEKDKAVVGVYAGLSVCAEDSVVHEQLAVYNAVGEGSILVTDTGGNIETGDYICSSNNLGHGIKQDDDSLRNYTVAKANEPIDFSTVEVDPELGFKSVLVACTYHCG